MNKFPNFFIIGAPKCGTTALSEYLKLHPEVFFSDPKEPHFFNDDYSTRHTNDFETYKSYFQEVKEEHKAIGEGSVHYLASKNAVKNIKLKAPNAKYIVMLRNPIEVAYSWHSQSIKNSNENVMDFEKAWSLEKERKKGNMIPRFTKRVETLFYREVAMLGSQVKRLLDEIERKNVHFIIFDDFIKNTEFEYNKVLKFLTLNEFKISEFKRINSNKGYKSIYLKFILEYLIRLLKRLLKIKKSFKIYSRFSKWNTKPEQRKKLNPNFEIKLKKFYKSEVETLDQVLGLDLQKKWGF